MADDYTDKYNTPIPADKQNAFKAWQQKHNNAKDKYDYDIQGAFLAGEGQDPRGHMTDRFKKPNHPTFSNESIYHGQNGNYGGSWGSNSFTPSLTNLQHHTPQELHDYFNRTEPGYAVNPMPTDPIGNAGAAPQPPPLQGLFASLLGLR